MAKWSVQFEHDLLYADSNIEMLTILDMLQPLHVGRSVLWHRIVHLVVGLSVDVEKAFLQGMAYRKLSQFTGEPFRDVSFVLPTGSIAALHQLPGYGNFDPATECLHCDKPRRDSRMHRMHSRSSSNPLLAASAECSKLHLIQNWIC